MRRLGIRVTGGTKHRVVSCDIHHTGQGGLMLSGGERKTRTPAGHEAVDNHIWRFSEHQLTSAYGLSFEGVGNRAAHNLIHDITKPPYTTRYPELVGYLDPPAGVPRVNHAHLNLLVRCGEVSGGNWRLEQGANWSTNDDPGFVKGSKGDYRLRRDAPVFKHLAGLKPIPFEKMGLQRQLPSAFRRPQ